MNWQTLSTASPYRTAVAIKQEIEEGRIEEATIGLEELIEALSRSEKRALKSQLVRLMLHIIKWQAQPERRSLSWIASIEDARATYCFELSDGVSRDTATSPLARSRKLRSGCTQVETQFERASAPSATPSTGPKGVVHGPSQARRLLAI
uniref:DUF29 family protein n=1 Tax=Thiocapsa sp. TaxID=2024551 RepID=UPI0035935A0F